MRRILPGSEELQFTYYWLGEGALPDQSTLWFIDVAERPHPKPPFGFNIWKADFERMQSAAATRTG